jgi:hypothetical protein
MFQVVRFLQGECLLLGRKEDGTKLGLIVGLMNRKSTRCF